MTQLPRARAQAGIGTRVAHDPGDPLITSHCPFCGSGQVVGRSDGTISCDFCGQAYIVRVQPAFPGIPQMPAGPGAPSDIGPDGGLMDPGMVGPDGLPMDGGPPPGEDDGSPFGDGAPDDEGAGPPPGDNGDDSKKSDSGSKPSDKGKKDKKKAAVSRQASYPRYTPHEREVLPLHMMSHHGWTREEAREATEWPEAANVLPSHHDAEHAQYGTAIQAMHIPHAHADLSHDISGGSAPPAWMPPEVPDSPPGWLGREGSRRYRGLGGQSLNEDQLVRHLAASLSGFDPAVMASLRATARPRARRP